MEVSKPGLDRTIIHYQVSTALSYIISYPTLGPRWHTLDQCPQIWRRLRELFEDVLVLGICWVCIFDEKPDQEQTKEPFIVPL